MGKLLDMSRCLFSIPALNLILRTVPVVSHWPLDHTLSAWLKGLPWRDSYSSSGNDTHSSLLFAYGEVRQSSPIQTLAWCLQGHLENLYPSSEGIRKMFWKRMNKWKHSPYHGSCAGHKVNMLKSLFSKTQGLPEETGPGDILETLFQPRTSPNP